MSSQRKTFRFKQFEINDINCAMKLSTDAVILGAWAKLQGSKSILDIGTGCGILALIAAQRSQATIDAIDIDRDSFLQAKDNFSKSVWSHRFKISHTSLQDFYKQSIATYDYVICNPPYFKDSMKSPSERLNLAKHDIKLNYETLFAISKKLIPQYGTIGIIIPSSLESHVIETANIEGLSLNRKLHILPNPNKEKNRSCMEFSLQKKHTQTNELMIRNSKHDYTDEYKLLTKEFYTIF